LTLSGVVVTAADVNAVEVGAVVDGSVAETGAAVVDPSVARAAGDRAGDELQPIRSVIKTVRAATVTHLFFAGMGQVSQDLLFEGLSA
jgi:hypothetical protein